MKKLLLYTLLCLAAGACVYPYNPQLEETAETVPVVEGNIVIGGMSHVTLRTMTPLSSGAVVPAPKGSVYLEGDNGQIIHADKENVSYFNLDSRTASPSRRYRLVLTIGGETYSTDWTLPLAAPTLKEVVFDADQDNVYGLLSLEGEGSYAAVSHEEIWRFHTEYLRTLSYNDKTNVVTEMQNPAIGEYWCWHYAQNSRETLLDYREMGGVVKRLRILQFARSNNRNHQEYHVRVKVRGLSAEEYRYRKQMEDNASGSGSLFSPEPGEVHSNVHCDTDAGKRILGYVSISQVADIQAQLDERYQKYYKPGALDVFPKEQWKAQYQKGYIPVTWMSDGESIGWGEKRCCNCVADGGTLEKPTFEDNIPVLNLP